MIPQPLCFDFSLYFISFKESRLLKKLNYKILPKMKKLIILLILINYGFTNIIYTQSGPQYQYPFPLPFPLPPPFPSPNYEPLLINDSWKIRSYNWGGGGVFWIVKECEAEFNGISYAEIQISEDDFVYMREDVYSGKVYQYIPETDEEHLVMDYNIQIGSTVELFVNNWGIVEFTFFDITFNSDLGRNEYWLEIDDYMVLWVEGLGSKLGPILPPPITDPDWTLECVIQDSEIAYIRNPNDEASSLIIEDCPPITLENSCLSYNLVVDDLTPTTVRLGWCVGWFVNYTKIEYKESGASEWNTLPSGVELSYKLENLTPNTPYIWRLRTECCDGTHITSVSSFSTPTVSSTDSVNEYPIKVVGLDGKLQINSPAVSVKSYAIYDIMGNLLMEGKNLDESDLIEIRNMPSSKILLVQLMLENNQTRTYKVLSR